MTIASEISRLQCAKSDICSSIENKGVTVGNIKLDQYAACIDAIQQGGGGAGNGINICYYLLGGGGGGGGGSTTNCKHYGGGGGGGGYRSGELTIPTHTGVQIKIGAGGGGGNEAVGAGCPGHDGGDTYLLDSTLLEIRAYGGGGGGSLQSAGNVGGSGGGGGGNSGAGGQSKYDMKEINKGISGYWGGTAGASNGGGGGGGVLGYGFGPSSSYGGCGGVGITNILGEYVGSGGGGSGLCGAGYSCGGGYGGYSRSGCYCGCNATTCGSGGGGGSCNGIGGDGAGGIAAIKYPIECGYTIVGGTKCTCGDDYVHFFCCDGTIGIVSDKEITTNFVSYIAVGGGGGGCRGGGGGGEVKCGYIESADTISINIGTGGIAGTDGGDTCIGDIVIKGGKAGGVKLGGDSGSGNSGGLNYYTGSCSCCGASGGGGMHLVGGIPRVNNTETPALNAGAGGGHGGQGMYGYGGGGGGGGQYPGCGKDGGGDGATTGLASDGTCFGGGGGGSKNSNCGGAGANGMVEICYLSDGSRGVHTATGGDCCYTCDGYCVHRFTTNGTFTITS